MSGPWAAVLTALCATAGTRIAAASVKEANRPPANRRRGEKRKKRFDAAAIAGQAPDIARLHATPHYTTPKTDNGGDYGKTRKKFPCSGPGPSCWRRAGGQVRARSPRG